MLKKAGLIVLLLDICLQNIFRHGAYGISNTGVSFGLFPGVGQGIALIFLMFLLVYFVFINKSRSSALLLLIFGGLGNFLPRFFWGEVRDYIFFPFLPFWFNLSDILITAGVASYILGIDGNSDYLRRQGHDSYK